MVLEGLSSITKSVLETENKLNRHLSAWRSRASDGVKMGLLRKQQKPRPENTQTPTSRPDNKVEDSATLAHSKWEQDRRNHSYTRHFSESQNRDECRALSAQRANSAKPSHPLFKDPDKPREATKKS